MKLFCANYTSPIETEGKFENVYFEDVSYSRNRLNNSLIIIFEMYYLKNDKRIVLSRLEMSFLGNEEDAISSNKTLFVEIANPDYDALVEGSQEKLTVPLLGSDGNYNFDVQTIPFEIVDYGYPTCEKVLQYFEGGSLLNPEITVTDPLAMGFVLNTFFIKNEKLGLQFSFI